MSTQPFGNLLDGLTNLQGSSLSVMYDRHAPQTICSDNVTNNVRVVFKVNPGRWFSFWDIKARISGVSDKRLCWALCYLRACRVIETLTNADNQNVKHRRYKFSADANSLTNADAISLSQSQYPT